MGVRIAVITESSFDPNIRLCTPSHTGNSGDYFTGSDIYKSLIHSSEYLALNLACIIPGDGNGYLVRSCTVTEKPSP